MTAGVWVFFVVACSAGAVARVVVHRVFTAPGTDAFPTGTLVVNITGSCVLGVIAGLALHHGLTDAPRLVAGTAFCGSYTTFSTFSVDAVLMRERGERTASRNYVALSVAGCIAAAAIGLAVTAL